MKQNLLLALLISSLLQASPEADEKVLTMLKQLNQTSVGGSETFLPPPTTASLLQQNLAKKSEGYEVSNKEVDMLSSRVQKDLVFEQKLPRAIGYSKIGDTAIGIVHFSGKRFRLGVNDEMAGWKIEKIANDGIYMKSRDGYSFKSHYDAQQQ